MRSNIFDMEGIEFARWVETELAARGIKKGVFYNKTGLSATAMYNWKKGSTPTADSISAVEEFFGVKYSGDITPTAVEIDPDLAELLNSIRSRPDLGVLLRSASDVPPSSVYEIVSKLEKMKENAT